MVEAHADLAVDARIDLPIVCDPLLLVLLPVLKVGGPVLWRALLQHEVLNFFETRGRYETIALQDELEELRHMPLTEIHERLDCFCVDGLAVWTHEEDIAFAILPAFGNPAEVGLSAGFEVVVGGRVYAALREAGGIEDIDMGPARAGFDVWDCEEGEADTL